MNRERRKTLERLRYDRVPSLDGMPLDKGIQPADLHCIPPEAIQQVEVNGTRGWALREPLGREQRLLSNLIECHDPPPPSTATLNNRQVEPRIIVRGGQGRTAADMGDSATILVCVVGGGLFLLAIAAALAWRFR